MSASLIASRRFLPLFLTQFFAAFNDNFLKNSLVFLVLMKAGAEGAASTVTLAGVVFIAPFLFLSALGGELADKFDKAKLARVLKLAEIVAVAIAIAGMALADTAVLMASLFLFGVGSALFGPVKYGILPDHLAREDLPKANAWIEGATFIAILAGTVSAGAAFAAGGGDVLVFGPLLAAFAIAACVASFFVPPTGRAAPAIRIDANILRSTVAMIGNVRHESRLWIATLMSSWFWLAGTIVLSVLPPLVRQIGGSDIAITACLCLFAVSVGIGSALAAWLSGGRIVLLPSVAGTILVALLCIDLALAARTPVPTLAGGLAAFFTTATALHVAADLAGIAVGGALMAVPTFAAIQSWAGRERRSRVVAGANIVNSAFMTVGGALVAGLQYAGMSITGVLAGFGAICLAVSVLMLVELPTDPLDDAHFVVGRLFAKRRVPTMKAIGPTKETEIEGLSGRTVREARIDTTIHRRVVDAAREFGHAKTAVEDPVAGALSYGRLLAGSRVLARRFAAMAPGEDNIGVMLPSANGAAVTVLAVMSAGKVPAMINFTAGAAGIRSACTAAGLRTILTSRAFVDKAGLAATVDEVGAAVGFVYLEDVRATIGLGARLAGFLLRSRALVRRRADDPAVIMFTSGSEGTPKGVVLTHRNILSNAAQAAARIDFSPDDKLFNVLPLFHAFGLTAGLVLPVISGVPVYLYPSPLHYRIVARSVGGFAATVLFGTDTFLAGYARAASAANFRSLRYCFAGAEPVREKTRTAYREKFGLDILEGYGVTEASPVIAINTPLSNRSGSVGKALPGIETRLEPVAGIGEGGRLLIRGPNVMAGHLKAESPGVLEPPLDGWHDTGDIVVIDPDGFVFVKGRARRFAKIAGEMVSLAAVEALAAELWPDATSAAAALPNAGKGERVVLMTDQQGATPDALKAAARARGISPLGLPGEIVVGSVPLLGSGKIDFVAVRRSLEKHGGRPGAA